MRIAINDLIKTSLDASKMLERVLWIDEDEDLVITIDVFSEKALPIKRNYSGLCESLDAQESNKVTTDPWFRIVDETKLKDKDKQVRERGWYIIGPIVSAECLPHIFFRHTRGHYIQDAIERCKGHKNEVYRLLRRYWQRGMTINALLPDYDKSGGHGKRKTRGDKKLGRPRKFPTVIGGDIDQEARKIMDICIVRFLLRKGKIVKPKDAYDLMMLNYFTKEDAELDYAKINRAPTLDQFTKYFRNEFKVTEIVKAREGKTNYAQNFRAITGTSQQETFGPGQRFQIDATVGDVYLLAEADRKSIIGRPVMYIVQDVFSRIISGFYIGLEGPSWTGAMMALANTVTDKVAFCAEYGIAITNDQWPCRHLPETILADRGELEGANIESLIHGLKVTVENAAPYRPDWKGAVERFFRTIHDRVRPEAPGFVLPDYRKRGAQDYRLDATMTLSDFTQLVIGIILMHNENVLNSYECDAQMVKDGVTPTPIELWSWGVKKRSGSLRTIPEDLVKLYLLPSARATVTPKGIQFKKMYYSCEKAMTEEWFDRARIKGNWPIDISFDHRNMTYIYIPDEDGRGYTTCRMLERLDKYIGRSFEDILFIDELENSRRKGRNDEMLQNRLKRLKQSQQIIENAIDKKTEFEGSNRQQVQGIRSNRAIEKEKNRKKEAFVLASEEIGKTSAEVVPLHPVLSPGASTKNPKMLAILKQIQKEKTDGQ